MTAVEITLYHIRHKQQLSLFDLMLVHKLKQLKNPETLNGQQFKPFLSQAKLT